MVALVQKTSNARPALQDEQTNYQKQMDNVNSGVTFENENSFFL